MLESISYYIQSISRWLLRCRYSRGFGIQSPSAYSFERYVVNEHDPYYAYDYDRRWISLHGMGAFLASSNPGQAAKPLMVAEDQRQAVIAKTRKDYFDGFRESLDELRASAAAKR